MRNTFTGHVPEFPNKALHAIISEVLTFRKQLTVRPEFTSQSGWNDPLNAYMKKNIEKIAHTVVRVAHDISEGTGELTLARRIAEAKDTGTTAASQVDADSINTDDLVMSAPVINRPLPYNFTGSDKNLPQPTPEKIPNDWARSFICDLDALVVQITNLDSRSQAATINAPEVAQLQATLNELYMICLLKGGEANRTEIPTGVLPNEMPNTFNYGGEHDPKPTETE